MVISMLQPVRAFPMNGILSLNMQIKSQQKCVPELSPADKTLFANIEASAKKMTQQELMAMMGLVH